MLTEKTTHDHAPAKDDHGPAKDDILISAPKTGKLSKLKSRQN